MENLILHYGLIAISLGAAIEGEPFALAGGVLAHRHWLSPVAAVLAVAVGASLIDLLWFTLSRHFRQSRLVQSVVQRPAFARSLALIERHPIGFVLLFRFAYGVRAVAAVAIGASHMPTKLFLFLDMAAAIIWAILFTALGYALGPAFEDVAARYGSGITAIAAFLSISVLLLAMRRGRG